LGHYTGLQLPTDPPKIQADNKAKWNEERQLELADFYTLGYMGRTIDSVLAALSANGICSVLDVRYTPVSMYKPEFSKSNLRRALEDHGIQYRHAPQLGVPRDIRGLAVEHGSRDPIWEWYDTNVVTQYVGKNLHRFFNVLEHPVALMCVESDPTACHRHRLTLAFERLGLRGFDL
jgi:uncharacterized protein (DUF488 family)